MGRMRLNYVYMSFKGNIPPSKHKMNTILMEFRSMLLRMQMYDELQKDFVLFYALERIIFIQKCEATNYFRLVLMTQRPVTSLTDAA